MFTMGNRNNRNRAAWQVTKLFSMISTT